MINGKRIDCELTKGFFKHYQEIVRKISIPYQWEILNDQIYTAERSSAVRNLQLAAGLTSGEYYGTCFQDSDVAKWLEAVSYSLETHPNPQLESIADSLIDLLSLVQQADGYLNSYFTVKEPGKRFTNLRECCELYCFGHLTEAAVAYYEATGKSQLLKIACHYADLLCETFGPKEGQLRGYDGHPEAELALVRLYETTGQRKYLELADFFLSVRGEEPYYMDIEWEKRNRSWHYEENRNVRPSDDRIYDCARIPPRYQRKAEGHAVKVGYLITGMAAVYAHTSDAPLLEACHSIYQNIIHQKMYITGGIGSSRHQERFTFDYDLPNDRAYAETCAAVSLCFFSRRMMSIEPAGPYADTLERILFNGSISGMSLDGKHFFYVNPLEVFPEVCKYDEDFVKVAPLRPEWHWCACCPPNLIRLLASVHKYIYSYKDDVIYVHLYASSTISCQWENEYIHLTQETDYPWQGEIKFTVSGLPDPVKISLRIPDWCHSWQLFDEAGNPFADAIRSSHYVTFHPGKNCTFYLSLALEPYCVKSNCLVKANAGKAALMRGPIVYCMEESDNYSHLYDIIVSPEFGFRECPSSDFAREELSLNDSDSTALYTEAIFLEANLAWLELPFSDKELYSCTGSIPKKKITARFVPYFLWGNRNGDTPREMQIWFRTDKC